MFFHTKLTQPCLYAPSVHLMDLMLKQEGIISKLYPEVGSIKLSKLYSYARALRNLGAKPKSQKITPTPQSPLQQILHQTLCSQASHILLATAKPRLIHQIPNQRGRILHFRQHVSTAL
ncbi:hypothetical protein ILYODFUR_015740 [Ilyodon furcidens]|uniref:Uncharacterized protein n=1 Tax=Ilyodon furcidens TaxID=33524 RepID=A0ABV0USA4_9TELE